MISILWAIDYELELHKILCEVRLSRPVLSLTTSCDDRGFWIHIFQHGSHQPQVASEHLNVADATEELNLSLCLMLINLNVDSHVCLEATISISDGII